MIQHKRYVINWHARVIAVYVAGAFSHDIAFAAALAYQRNIVAKLLASLDRNGFEMAAPTEDGAWVYEGWAI